MPHDLSNAFADINFDAQFGARQQFHTLNHFWNGYVQRIKWKNQIAFLNAYEYWNEWGNNTALLDACIWSCCVFALFYALFILTFIINTRIGQSFVTSRQLTQIDQKRL